MIRLPRACRGRTAVWFPANSSHMRCVEQVLGKVPCTPLISKGETAVSGSHFPRDMAVRMREVSVRPWVGVCVPLAFTFALFSMQ